MQTKPRRHYDPFSGFHPIVNFLYFALVLLFGMIWMHPACLLISLVGSITYVLLLRGGKALALSMKVMLPLLLLTVLINPALNHNGQTILAYLPSGNPITLESLAYGLAAGTMLAAILLWFSCCSQVLTSDKLLYLFGRFAPAVSLLLSMTLRFVPRCKAQFDAVRQARCSLNQHTDSGKPMRRIRSAMGTLSIVVTWALESAIDTADSMKSRGYGLPGRTAFSLYRFDRRDKAALLWLILCGGFLAAAALAGSVRWSYFPRMQGAFPPLTICTLAAYLALCLTPAAIRIREDIKWKFLTYKI